MLKLGDLLIESVVECVEPAGKLTETMLLGCIALRIADKNTTLQWDGPNMRFTNLDMANRYIDKKYRKGWSM